MDENGFTEAERKRISNVMREVIDAEDPEAKMAEVRSLVEGLRDQRFRRRAGMTIGQIQEVAAAVTERYRGAGFILAQAFVPAQEVKDGVVFIEVFEGKLGAVVFQGNEMYREAVLAAPFSDLIDTPVSADSIETAMLQQQRLCVEEEGGTHMHRRGLGFHVEEARVEGAHSGREGRLQVCGQI